VELTEENFFSPVPQADSKKGMARARVSMKNTEALNAARHGSAGASRFGNCSLDMKGSLSGVEKNAGCSVHEGCPLPRAYIRLAFFWE
jgi:hypothetical protein